MSASRAGPPEDASTAPVHVAALDGVRGLAIVIVLIHNAGWVQRGADGFALKLVSAVTGTGWAGVQVFFVLSGFLITGILLDALGSERYFGTFYTRRTLRIFPLYYATLALAFFVVPHLADLAAWSATVSKNQWWYWTYTANWAGPLDIGVPGLSHFWSLAVEEQFYLVWPLLVFHLPRRRLLVACLTIIAFTPFLRYVLVTSAHPRAAYDWTIARWDALAMGAVLAIAFRDGRGSRWLERRAAKVTAVAALALVALVAKEHGFLGNDLWVVVLGQSLISALSAALIYFGIGPVVGRLALVRGALSARWLRFMGKYSYAIYVFHFPIHTIAMYYTGDWINSGGTTNRLGRLAVYMACVSTLSVVAALMSWRVLEKPFLDLKERLAPRRATSGLNRPAPVPST